MADQRVLTGYAPELFAMLREIVNAGSSGDPVKRAVLYLKAEALLHLVEGTEAPFPYYRQDGPRP